MELVFPVRGHSFLPCDRLFGRIEKELKTVNTILLPSGFHTVFSNHCSAVFKFGIDWISHDWKKATSSIYKPLSGIQDAKRIILSKCRDTNGIAIKVRCENSYNCDVAVPTNLLKRGQQYKNIKLVALPTNRPIAAAKLKDIHNLLGVAFGPKWRKLDDTQLYQTLRCVDNVAGDDEPGNGCDCADEDISFRV